MRSCSISNYIQRDGFVMVSNLLIQYQKELGITNRELMFLIKVMKHKENYKLHDDVLDPTVSSRTLQRCRKSLSDKGLIDFKIWKYTDEKGHIHTEGITYDLMNLELRLQEISDAIAEDKDKILEKEAKDYIIEYEDDSPMAEFLKKWEEHYGDKYNLTLTEKEWYNNLNEEGQRAVGEIFNYCEEYKLFKEITPRLILFIKNKYRFDKLLEYSNDKPRDSYYTINEVSKKPETREEWIKYYNDMIEDLKKNMDKKDKFARMAAEGTINSINKKLAELNA